MLEAPRAQDAKVGRGGPDFFSEIGAIMKKYQ